MQKFDILHLVNKMVNCRGMKHGVKVVGATNTMGRCQVRFNKYSNVQLDTVMQDIRPFLLYCDVAKMCVFISEENIWLIVAPCLLHNIAFLS